MVPRPRGSRRHLQAGLRHHRAVLNVRVNRGAEGTIFEGWTEPMSNKPDLRARRSVGGEDDAHLGVSGLTMALPTGDRLRRIFTKVAEDVRAGNVNWFCALVGFGIDQG